MNKLYATIGSGNCFKAHLAMNQLGIAYETVLIDVLKGETRGAEFLSVNPNGTVPFLRLADGRGIAESNAMIWYLAKGTYLFPKTSYEEAIAVQWMIYEQTHLEPNISPARFFTTIVPSRRAEMETQIAGWQEKGAIGLARLNEHLKHHDFISGVGYSIADIAVYGYTHVADEGGFDLDEYPAVLSWMNRVAATDGYIPMNELSLAA